MKDHERCTVYSLLIAAILLLFPIVHSYLSDASTREITGRMAASTGLPQDASYSTVEVYDNDGDGLYEIYLGGAGRNPKTKGIYAFEYNPAGSSWSAFGSGLPGSDTGGYYGGLGLGDVNGDGNVDIAAPVPTSWYGGTQAVYLYTSDGSSAFTLAHTFSPGASTNEAEIADLDGDGYYDIAYSYFGGVTVQYGSGSATSWTEVDLPSAGNELDGIGIGDLNHDGLLDLVSTPYFSSKAVRMYVQDPARTWTEVTFRDTANEAFGIKILDLNGDGDTDVVYGSRGEGIKAFAGNGGGSTGGTSFTWTDISSGLPTGGGSWQQLELGDINGDGKPDLISSSDGGSRARVFANNLPGDWTELFSEASEQLTTGGTSYGANFADINGDGQLDCLGCSWGGGADAWIVTTSSGPGPSNSKPAPEAGPDQEVMLGDAVQLDGTGSSDTEDAPSGDAAGSILTYDWNVTSYPQGSAIRDGSLSPSDSDAEASFTPDRVGAYTLTLAVRDTDGDWSPSVDELLITVLKPNDPPVADAGPDQSVRVGDPVTLDGSDSRDPDGEILEYEWTCTSHQVTLSDPSSASPTFTPDTAGIYNFRLRVRDDNDTWSDPDTMNVTVSEAGVNLPPTADAGRDQSITLGETAELDGSGSEDPDGEVLEYEWTCISHTGITFTGQNTSSPSFVPTSAGTYIIRLRMRDINNTWSSEDTVRVTVTEPVVNSPPIANAGEDRTVTFGSVVTLDGTGSIDTDGTIVEYDWVCTSHSVVLANPDSDRPSFTAAEVGTYVFTLAVRDDDGEWSPVDSVSIISKRDTFDITIGPFLLESGDPVVGAAVLLNDGALEYNGETGSDGKCTFQGLRPGEYRLTLSLPGYETLRDISIEVQDDGSLLLPGGQLPTLSPVDDEKDNTGSSPALYLALGAVLVLVLIGAGAGVFVLTGKKDEGSRDGKTEGDADEAPKRCSGCGGEMRKEDDFSRYRCVKCGGFD